MLAYGNYFWQAQKVDLYAPHIDQSAIVGTFTCGELIDRVKATVRVPSPEWRGHRL